jgi:hypothetical protein
MGRQPSTAEAALASDKKDFRRETCPGAIFGRLFALIANNARQGGN